MTKKKKEKDPLAEFKKSERENRCWGVDLKRLEDLLKKQDKKDK